MNGRAVLLSVGAFILAAGGIFWLMSKDSTNQKNLPPVAVSSKTAPRLSPQNVPQPPHRPAPPNGVKTANNAAVSTPIQDKYVLHSTHPGRAEMPPPDYFPRPKSEWQGMKIDMTLRPFCDETAQCALGLVCREEHCLPCLKDDECLADEVCVLDHCVRHELAECTQKADCGEEELCVLTGYYILLTRGAIRQCAPFVPKPLANGHIPIIKTILKKKKQPRLRRSKPRMQINLGKK